MARLHEVAVLTDTAIAPLEAIAGAAIISEETVAVDPVILWLLLQTYRDHHNVNKS